MKGCAVFKRNDDWYFHGLTRTTAGVLIATAPYRRISIESAAQLGQVCLEAIQTVTDSVPHPTEFASHFQPMLELAGVKSWGQFTRNAPYVDVIADHESYRISPTRNAGPKQGYDAATAGPITLPLDASAKQIGEAVQQAFDLCE